MHFLFIVLWSFIAYIFLCFNGIYLPLVYIQVQGVFRFWTSNSDQCSKLVSHLPLFLFFCYSFCMFELLVICFFVCFLCVFCSCLCLFMCVCIFRQMLHFKFFCLFDLFVVLLGFFLLCMFINRIIMFQEASNFEK